MARRKEELVDVIGSTLELAFPRDRGALATLLHDTLALQFPSSAVEANHATPMDYLSHAFFEGREAAGGAPAPSDCVVWANRGGGKTFLGAVATAMDLIFKPGIEIRVLGGSLDQARRMHSHLRTIFSKPLFEGLIDGEMTERRLTLRNGSRVELLAQSQTSVRGTRVQKLRCDEVELFDADVWEAAQLTTREATLTLADGRAWRVPGTIECLSTMHRPFGLMRRVVEEAQSGSRAIFRWGVLDVLASCEGEHECQTCSLEPECGGRAKAREAGNVGHITVRDAVRMKSRVSAATWESEMLCRRVMRSDCVYPEFDEQVHVVDRLPPHLTDVGASNGVRWVAGMDFGYRAPTVIVFGGVDDRGVLWITDEHIASETLLSTHVEALVSAARPAREWIGVDPAGEQTDGQTGASAVDVMRRSGLIVRAQRLLVRQGLEMVRARLRPADASRGPRLFVHRSCKGLIESLTQYHYPPDDLECDEPVKDGPDHAADALRYLVQNLDREVVTRRRNYA